MDIAVYYRPYPPAEPLLDCPAVEAGDLTSLGPASFGAAGCQHVEPGARVVFGYIMYNERDGGRTGCGAALIRAVGLPDTVLTWRTGPAPSASATNARLEGTAGNLQIAGTDFVAATPAAFTPRASNCPGIP